VSPPGETLRETLETIGISRRELAARIGRPVRTVEGIVRGEAAITSEMAIQLECVLGIPASFWQNRERNYRAYLSRVKRDGE